MDSLRSRGPTYGVAGRREESLHEIGRAFGKDHGSIQFLLSQHVALTLMSQRPWPTTQTARCSCWTINNCCSGGSIEVSRQVRQNLTY